MTKYFHVGGIVRMLTEEEKIIAIRLPATTMFHDIISILANFKARNIYAYDMMHLN